MPRERRYERVARSPKRPSLAVFTRLSESPRLSAPSIAAGVALTAPMSFRMCPTIGVWSMIDATIGLTPLKAVS